MSNVKNMHVKKRFTKESEMHQRLYDLICEYNGEVSLVATIGVIELLKLTLVNGNESS